MEPYIPPDWVQWAVLAGFGLVLAMAKHSVTNYIRKSDALEGQFGGFLVRLVRAEQCIQAIDQTVQANKATVATVQSAQQAAALDVAKLEGLQELRSDVREMRAGVDKLAREFSELRGQLKRSSSGQHPARR